MRHAAASTAPDLDLASMREDVIAVAREAEHRCAELAERRALPHDLSNALVDTGVFRLWVAREYGGACSHPLDLYRLIEEAAYWEASVAWIIMVCGTAGRVSGVLEPESAASIFADPRSVLCGFAGPGGVGTEVPDGIRVTGTWPWGSGTQIATHVGGLVHVVGAGGDRTVAGARSVWAVFERGQVVLENNWDTLGLQGTASGHYSVKNALVPAKRWISSIAAPGLIDDPLFRFAPVGALAGGVAAVCLGIGRRAVDELYRFGSTKQPQGSQRSLAHRPVVQGQVAHVEGGLRAARALLWETAEKAYDEARHGTTSEATRRLLRLAATNAASRSREAVDTCHLLAGGSSIWRGHPLLKAFQDMHVATAHAAVASPTYEVLGRIGFGLETDTTMI